MFRILDSSGDGNLCFNEFIMAMRMITSPNLDEKLRWVFKLYDQNGDHVVTKTEMIKIMTAVDEMLGKEHLYLDYHSVESAETRTDRLFNIIDIDNDGFINENEFVTGAKNDPSILEFLNLFSHCTGSEIDNMSYFADKSRISTISEGHEEEEEMTQVSRPTLEFESLETSLSSKIEPVQHTATIFSSNRVGVMKPNIEPQVDLFIGHWYDLIKTSQDETRLQNSFPDRRLKVFSHKTCGEIQPQSSQPVKNIYLRFNSNWFSMPKSNLSFDKMPPAGKSMSDQIKKTLQTCSQNLSPEGSKYVVIYGGSRSYFDGYVAGNACFEGYEILSLKSGNSLENLIECIKKS